MSRRYRLYPTPEQEVVLHEHCAHARYVWNLAMEQQSWWQPGRQSPPSWNEQSRQLTEARAEFKWLRHGSAVVQQQAIRDFTHAMLRFFAGTHGKPSWRKAGRREGFRVVDICPAERLSRKTGRVFVPKIGWVRFRWSRPLPPEVKSYRVTVDRAGRWHVSFVAVPAVIPGPGTGEVIGVDCGIVKTVALSDGSAFQIPAPRPTARLHRHLDRAKRGSARKEVARSRLARRAAKNRDTQKDWIEKTTTDIARRFDVIRIEDLRIGNMTRSARGTLEQPGTNVRQKTALNRLIQQSRWGTVLQRLQDKAPGRVEKVNPRFTSQRCSACGHVDAKSRKSQADFVCTACGYADNADVNAARNIAAGYAVTARGGPQVGPTNREPQIAA